MIRSLTISVLAGFGLAACSTVVEPAPEEQRLAAAPRPSLTSMVVGGVSVRTLADGASVEAIAAQTSDRVAGAFAGDNKGNACFKDPEFQGVAGGELNTAGTRREEFWIYTVCGETYEVPVIVTKQQSSGAVAFTVGSGREAR